MVEPDILYFGFLILTNGPLRITWQHDLGLIWFSLDYIFLLVTQYLCNGSIGKFCHILLGSKVKKQLCEDLHPIMQYRIGVEESLLNY